MEKINEKTGEKNNLEHSRDPLEDGISSIELIRISGSDIDIVNAARVSFGKFITEMSERDEKLLKFLMEHEHTTPFEHNQLSFRIKAPLFVVRQWMRHRMNSYNEISYRYVKAPLEFYVPQQWRAQDTQNKQASVGAFADENLKKTYLEAITQSTKAYETLLEQGVCRELARGLLPLATYTQFIYTCNLHSFMHFLKLRLHSGAQREIRRYAEALFLLAKPHFPVALREWQKIHLSKNLAASKEADTFTPAFVEAVEE